MELKGESDGLLGGRYRLGELLGRGGGAAVYAAVDVMLGREVAVKRFVPSDSRIALYRFGAEARLLAGLSHPALVTVHDVCLDDDRPYLVMELVRGDTLRRLLDGGPIDPITVARMGARIADVLAYIHDHDVVHRDIKPANVLVDDIGDAYLADFGIARALGAAHLTVSGELVGTAAYLAPEQVTDVDTGPEADIYALGLVLLECLNGEPEYTGTTAEAAVARLSRRPRVPRDLSSSWRGLLTAMTEWDPADRPDAARCAELLTALARDPLAKIPAPRPAAGRLRAVHAAVSAAVLVGATVLSLSAATNVVPGEPVGGPEPTSTQPGGTQDTTPRDPIGRHTRIPVAPAVGTVTTEHAPSATRKAPPPAAPGKAPDPAKDRGPNENASDKAKEKARKNGH
ncbi:serine/threonine-protein kinase [Actinophytocola gossypii]|uniref:non-specific serine/threonine protein kinase n=1 Tax=Actinophytocola gossypii TaxID=2812003 RepID=A0ABT2J8E7_9PSEU|nr:serine/threonine-protein kinase [Actinophytocola gossypii]MCT2583554.1 serine/threonine protein kinase [Actinophytocola gossypii]